MEINYHLPSFTDHFSLNILLDTYMKEHPERFRDGVRIASVFGSFSGAAWNGGRNVPGNYNPKLNEKIMKEFNSRGIPLRFTFTNPMLTEQHLSDKPCNEILKMAENGMNEVIVMSPILEQYIRENYPGYKITSSTCKQIRDMDDLNRELEKDYNLVVLDYNWNNRFDDLERIKDKAKCEVLVNAYCHPNCPNRGEHYRRIGKMQLELSSIAQSGLNIGMKNINKRDEGVCPFGVQNILTIKDFKTHVSPDVIEEKYLPMGFSQFKIEGRLIGDIEMLEMYIYYLVKPEYKDTARFEMLTRLTGRIAFFNIYPQ